MNVNGMSPNGMTNPGDTPKYGDVKLSDIQTELKALNAKLGTVNAGIVVVVTADTTSGLATNLTAMRLDDFNAQQAIQQVT